MYFLASFFQKESSPASIVENIDDDDGIDTNVTFDQEGLDYPASESGRRDTGASSSEMPSVYNTANVSPARSFSSGARSPDTVYLSGSEDLPQYMASPARLVGVPMSLQHSKAGANSPDPVISTQRPVSNVNDEFLARGGPTLSAISGAGPSSGGLRKRHSIAASSTSPLEVRSLKTSSSFTAPGGRVEEKPIAPVSKAIDEEQLSGGSGLRKGDKRLVAEGNVAAQEEPKSYQTPGAEASKETLGENWEMVSPVHQSKGLGPEWVSVPKPNISDTRLDVPSAEGKLYFLFVLVRCSCP